MTPNLLNKRKLKLSLTYLTVASIHLTALLLLTACSYNPKKLTPHFIDPDNNTTREYRVIQTKPEIMFEYVRTNTIHDAVVNNGGLLCLPVPQALDIKRKYEKHMRSKGNQTESLEFNDLEIRSYPRTIQEELEIINHIPTEQ